MSPNRHYLEITTFYMYVINLYKLQHYLIMFVSVLTIPLFFATAMCLELDSPYVNEIVNTLFLVCGIGTLLQSTIGVRFVFRWSEWQMFYHINI